MDPRQFSSDVKLIDVSAISPSPDNPRGTVQEDASFDRLVSSISEVGNILVPIVVREIGPRKYELVDGERRLLAAGKLRLQQVPAHVLDKDFDKDTIRKYMFHLHMTREQWGPLAQCKSLSEMYPEIEDGIPFDQKQEWAKRIATQTWMNLGTARDRVHVLAWPRRLKDHVLDFDSNHPELDIYSYVLAIEVSIIEPSVKFLSSFYNHSKRPEPKANSVRGSLFTKTSKGLETGMLTSRDQIRSVAPLFQPGLTPVEYKIAIKIFGDLVEKADFLYDDAVSAIQARAPELLAEKPPKPQRVLGLVRSLTKTLHNYQVRFIEDNFSRESAGKKFKHELSSVLGQLVAAARSLKGKLE